MPGRGPAYSSGVTCVFSRLACALVSGWLLFAPPAESGLRYHAQVALPADISVIVWVEGDRARLEIQASNEPNLAAGTALLTSDRGENLVVLDTAKQEFFSLSRDVITRFKQREADRRRVTCDPISSEKVAEDSGPALAGFPTRHLRFHIRLATHQPTASGELTTQIDVFEHFWLTGQIAQQNTDLAMLSDSSDTGVPALDEFLRAQLRELRGFVLKRTLVLTVDDSREHHRVVRNSYEVTELAVNDSPAALFEVPANFHLRVPPATQPAPPSDSSPRP